LLHFLDIRTFPSALVAGVGVNTNAAELQHDMHDVDISVLLPVYNERDNLAPLIEEIAAALRQVTHEIVAVDDGSTDGSRDELLRLRGLFPQLHVVTLGGRSGQSAALVAGLDAARGDVIVTMDADGQNDPADIPRLLELRGNGNLTAVVGVRANRSVGRWKRMQAWVANRVRDWITGDAVRDTGCALRIISKDHMLRLPRFRGMHRFVPTLLRLQGVQVIETPVADRPRRYGRSKYGMWNRVWVGWTDAWAVRWMRSRRLTYRLSEAQRAQDANAEKAARSEHL
jgi:glycosyltransferase involved in cell wall biosynthesis